MDLESEVVDLTAKTQQAEQYASLKARRAFELEQDKKVSCNTNYIVRFFNK